MWVHSKIRVHSGKTHVWNRSGRMLPACDELQRRAVLQDPTAQVWTGSGVPTQNQGIKVLGCPLGHEDFVTTQLEAIGTKHQVLWQAIPTVPDVQSAWLLLHHCAAARANFYLRVGRHDGSLWQCLSRILGMLENLCDDLARSSATLPLALGGLGLRSAERWRVATAPSGSCRGVRSSSAGWSKFSMFGGCAERCSGVGRCGRVGMGCNGNRLV